ncbi:Nop8p Ecym_2008 [Eremothecium cymbalariae DBVPG|uniref:RRM domain-containing protein n=1 Tax=Eremothecium cymbalariae (strain CBS 270.75 / DBVPG 7215 / KCTC 17166 / NRRL Y-17582) TaxID=931890 RepID=G8JNF8_ERECY|nr:Hypothetical protein Ecym_2008 [Eremothecium cymbalariae DBVPG\
MVLCKRVYVGNLYNDIERCTQQLYGRFGQFGKCLSSQFECHSHFAYIMMEFDSEHQLNRLKASFNNLSYMGNKLKIDVAKPDWKERWMIENQNKSLEEAKKRQMLSQQWEHYKKLHNIKKSWIDRKEVITGRVRKTPRSKHNLKSMTFRITMDGKLKVLKCYKTKLWGYERNKSLRDLVYSFTDKYWRDGCNHIVDRLDYSRTKNSLRFESTNGDSITVDLNHSTGTVEGPESSEEFKVEREITHGILNGMLENFDFAKPVELEVENEPADADYELNAMYKSELVSTEAKHPDQEVPPLGLIERSEDANGYESVSRAHNESKQLNTNIDKELNKNPAISNTEVLRNVFNPLNVENAQFKLIEESDEDIDHEKDISEPTGIDVIEVNKAVAIPENPINKGNPKGLFFPHWQSPFLLAQTQLHKVKKSNPNDQQQLTSWEEEFWRNRAAWTREMKLARRDVLRQLKKRNSRSPGSNILV